MGIDEARRHVRDEAAREARVDGADDEGQQLVPAHVDPGRGGRDRILAQGLERVSHPRAQNAEREVDAEQGHRHQQEPVPGPGVEGEVPDCRRRDVADAQHHAEIGRHGDEDAHRLGEAQGREREIGALEPERGNADDHARRRGDRHRRGQREPERQPEVERQDGRGVGPDREEADVSDGDLAREALDDVEPDREQDHHAGVVEQVDLVLVPREPWQRGQHDGGQRPRRERMHRAQSRERRGGGGRGHVNHVRRLSRGEMGSGSSFAQVQSRVSSPRPRVAQSSTLTPSS